MICHANATTTTVSVSATSIGLHCVL